MGVQFNAYDKQRETFAGEEVDMGASTAERLIDALGLREYCDDDPTWPTGQCPPAAVLDRLMAWTTPEGHPDELIRLRMVQLAELCRAALRAGPKVMISWV